LSSLDGSDDLLQPPKRFLSGPGVGDEFLPTRNDLQLVIASPAIGATMIAEPRLGQPFGNSPEPKGATLARETKARIVTLRELSRSGVQAVVVIPFADRVGMSSWRDADGDILEGKLRSLDNLLHAR
jgi:hypothetical protein